MSELLRLAIPISMERRTLREHLAAGALVLVEPVDRLWACPNGHGYSEYPDVCSCDQTTCDENGFWVLVIREAT